MWRVGRSVRAWHSRPRKGACVHAMLKKQEFSEPSRYSCIFVALSEQLGKCENEHRWTLLTRLAALTSGALAHMYAHLSLHHMDHQVAGEVECALVLVGQGNGEGRDCGPAAGHDVCRVAENMRVYHA